MKLLIAILAFLVTVSISQARDSSISIGKIAFVLAKNGIFDICVMDDDGSHIVNITNDPERDSFPSWSPDGNAIAFSRSGALGKEIYTIKVANGELKSLGFEGDFPSFHPTKDEIVFIAMPLRGKWQISIANANGENERYLTDFSKLSNKCISWSPDGSQLAICDYAEFYTIDADGQNRRKIVCIAPDGTIIHPDEVDWSPKGDKLAIVPSGEKRGIWTVNPDGSDAIRLTEDNDAFPEWSPDGSRIAFCRIHDESANIYVMDSDGRNVKNLTNSGDWESMPSWYMSTVSVQPRDNLVTTWGKLKNETGVDK